MPANTPERTLTLKNGGRRIVVSGFCVLFGVNLYRLIHECISYPLVIFKRFFRIDSMCRFLLVRAQSNIQPGEMLSSFADCCRKSGALGKRRQADGWGIAWQEEGAWSLHKSLRPIWEDEDIFSQFPTTRLWVAHARDASLDTDRANLSYNQPFLADSLCFVFNGMVRGVRLPLKADGEIGAQKIFDLIRKALASQDAAAALVWLDEILTRHSRQVIGLNVGLVKDERLHLLCEYGRDVAYFSLHYSQTDDFTLACSERLPGYPWRTMDKGQVLVL